MYKFTDLNIDHLLNAEVSEVAYAMYNLAVRFHNNQWINITGRYRLESNKGVLEEGNPEKHNPTTCVHQILDSKLTSYSIPSAAQLSLQFSNGMTLSIFDDSDMYECCSISPNIYI